MENRALERFNNDSAKVADYMAQQDAKAASYEADDADQEWKVKEEELEEWRKRMDAQIVGRKLLVVVFSFSLGFLVLDGPQAGLVIDGMMVLLFTFGVMVPPEAALKSHEPPSKTDRAGMEEPLLPLTT